MATLTITITEAVTLGDGSTDRGTTNIQTETVNEVDHRIMDVGTSYVSVMNFGAAAGAGTFKNDSIQHLRITNLDSSNFVTLRVSKSDAQYFIKLEPEDSFLLGNNKVEAYGGGDTLDAGETLGNIVRISAKADTAACQIEYFVASQD